MLERLLKRIRIAARKRLKPRKIKIHGLWFSTDSAHVPGDIRKALYREVYEDCERKLVLKAVKSGDRVLEIGAGTGFVSTICASICGPTSLLAYEPNPAAAAILKTNFLLNGMKANVRERGVAVEESEGSFYFSGNIFSSSVFDRFSSSPSVIKFDAFADVLNEFLPNVVVMDVEGAEVDLLPLLESSAVRTVIVEMHPHIVGADRCEQAIEKLSSMGYKERERCRGKIIWLQRDSVETAQ